MKAREIRVAQGSLTDGSLDLLINAGNTNMDLGSGVSGAIRQACGANYQAYLHDELLARCGGPMAPGEVLITNAGEHPYAQFVAHAAVMDYRQGFTGSSYPTLELVEKSYARIWEQVANLGETKLSVAVVALGGGTGKLGVRGPIEKACETLKAFFSGPRADAIGDLCFFGYSLVEYIAMVEVVSQHFELTPDSISPEVAQYLRS